MNYQTAAGKRGIAERSVQTISGMCAKNGDWARNQPGTETRLLLLRTHVWLALAMFVFTVPVAPQTRTYGPEVRSFLSFVKGEEDELNFQIRRGEISRKAYVRSKNRFAILRQAVLDRVRKTGEDRVPEFNVVTAEEIQSLLPDGLASIKGVKPGGKIGEKWRYVGSITRGERFYIVERLTQN
ncbi:MAG TPA: hypothetical protein VFV34_07350 [Blastocatellia bacterium]|nr:hypothetical protein [Blastocatellia bacterium]